MPAATMYENQAYSVSIWLQLMWLQLTDILIGEELQGERSYAATVHHVEETYALPPAEIKTLTLKDKNLLGLQITLMILRGADLLGRNMEDKQEERIRSWLSTLGKAYEQVHNAPAPSED